MKKITRPNQFTVCKEAFDYQLRAIDRNNVRLVLEDGVVMTSAENLLLFSPFLADIVASSQLEFITIIIPDVEKALITRLLNILTNGFTTLSLNKDILELGDGDLTEKIKNLAAQLGIKLEGLDFDTINLDNLMLDPIEENDLSLSFESDIEEESYQQLNNNKRPRRIRKKVFDGRYKYDLKCDHCTRTFQSKSTLTAHVNSVHRASKNFCSSKSTEKEKKYFCDWCQHSFFSHTNLERHQREVQYCKLQRLKIQATDSRKKGNVSKRRKTCEECGKSYSSQKCLKVHMDSAHLGITYPCHICEKNFSQKSNLAAHLLSQTHRLEVRNRENDL